MTHGGHPAVVSHADTSYIYIRWRFRDEDRYTCISITMSIVVSSVQSTWPYYCFNSYRVFPLPISISEGLCIVVACHWRVSSDPHISGSTREGTWEDPCTFTGESFIGPSLSSKADACIYVCFLTSLHRELQNAEEGPVWYSCRCLNHSTSMGGTRSKVEGGDRHDLEPEGTHENTRHEIYTGSGSRSSYPTSCLG
jgi:hypothetical protein